MNEGVGNQCLVDTSETGDVRMNFFNPTVGKIYEVQKQCRE